MWCSCAEKAFHNFRFQYAFYSFDQNQIVSYFVQIEHHCWEDGHTTSFFELENFHFFLQNWLDMYPFDASPELSGEKATSAEYHSLFCFWNKPLHIIFQKESSYSAATFETFLLSVIGEVAVLQMWSLFWQLFSISLARQQFCATVITRSNLINGRFAVHPCSFCIWGYGSFLNLLCYVRTFLCKSALAYGWWESPCSCSVICRLWRFAL